jgi:hypothetical protein
MAGKTPQSAPESREDRLKAALKANMAKRKAQARARSASGRDTAGHTSRERDAGGDTKAGED